MSISEPGVPFDHTGRMGQCFWALPLKAACGAHCLEFVMCSCSCQTFGRVEEATRGCKHFRTSAARPCRAMRSFTPTLGKQGAGDDNHVQPVCVPAHALPELPTPSDLKTELSSGRLRRRGWHCLITRSSFSQLEADNSART